MVTGRKLYAVLLAALLPLSALAAQTVVICPDSTSTTAQCARLGTVKSTGAAAARKDPALLTQTGESDTPSYVVPFSVAPTVAMDVISITRNVATQTFRLRRIVLVNPGNATAAAVVDLQLGLADAAGSGGAIATVFPVDTGNRSAGVTGGPDIAPGSARTGDTTLAANLVSPYNPLVTVAVPAAAGAFTPLTVYDGRDQRFKALTWTGSGPKLTMVLRIAAVGAGAANFRGYVEFSVDDA